MLSVWAQAVGPPFGGMCERVCQGEEGKGPTGLGGSVCFFCRLVTGYILGWCCSHQVLLRSPVQETLQEREAWH